MPATKSCQELTSSFLLRSNGVVSLILRQIDSVAERPREGTPFRPTFPQQNGAASFLDASWAAYAMRDSVPSSRPALRSIKGLSEDRDPAA